MVIAKIDKMIKYDVNVTLNSKFKSFKGLGWNNLLSNVEESFPHFNIQLNESF